METYLLIGIAQLCIHLGTDPTYKEWKPYYLARDFDKSRAHGSYLQGMETVYDIEVSGSFLFLSTDPTYKEWKHFLRVVVKRNKSSTDPTYKEWKQRGIFISSHPPQTRILPTRNGNYFFRRKPC